MQNIVEEMHTVYGEARLHLILLAISTALKMHNMIKAQIDVK